MSGEMTRRHFLDWLLALGGIGTTFVVAYPLLKYVNPPARTSEGGDWVDAGTVGELSPGTFKDIMGGTGIPLLVINQGDDKVVALEKKCPHLGCMVEYEDGELICPCHGAKFTLDGELIGGPAPRGLKQFAVEVRSDGHIFVGKELS